MPLLEQIPGQFDGLYLAALWLFVFVWFKDSKQFGAVNDLLGD